MRRAAVTVNDARKLLAEGSLQFGNEYQIEAVKTIAVADEIEALRADGVKLECEECEGTSECYACGHEETCEYCLGTGDGIPSKYAIEKHTRKELELALKSLKEVAR